MLIKDNPEKKEFVLDVQHKMIFPPPGICFKKADPVMLPENQ